MEEFEITLHVPKPPVFDRSWCVEGGETIEEARNRGGERAVVREEEEEAGTGVDWLEAGDRRPRPWPETKEEKEKNRGCRAGREEEERELGGGHASHGQFCPLFPFF